MRESLRKSGIDVIGDVPWGTHFCQFYQTKEDLMDILVPYFKAGLENNELCVWITSQPLEVEEAKEAMKRAVPDIDAYLEKGQMEIIPYTHGYIKEGIFDPGRVVNSWVEKINQVLARGYDGLRATGDTRWPEKEGWDDFVDYEKKIDAIIDKYHVIALCPYSLDRCSATEIVDAVINHQFALIKREGKWEQIENPRRKQAEEAAVQVAKEAEAKLKEAHESLEGLVEEKTRQLENTYKLLKERETELDEAQKMAHIGNWKWSIVTDEIRWSDEVYRIFGRNPQEFRITYETFLSYVHPDDRDYVDKAVKKGLSGDPFGIDYRIILANGEERSVYTQTKIIFDEKNTPIGATGIVQDITERKKAEEALRLSNIYNRSLIEASLDPLVTIGRDGKIMDVNGATEKVTGYSRNDLIGAYFSDYFTEPEKAFAGYQQVFTDGEVRDYPLEIQHKDGHITPVLYNASVYRDENGEVIGVFASARDITERKRAEETLAFERSQLLSIFDGIDDVVYVTDPYTYEVLYANKAMKEKFGGELVGGICYWEFQRKDTPCDFCTNQIILKAVGKPYHWEYYNPMVDRYFMIVDRIIKWPDGRDVRFEIAKDITKRKKAEEALRLSNIYNRSLIETSLDPLVTIGPEGKITDVNGATEQVTGYSRNDLIGTDFSDYFTEPEKARKGYQQVFTDGKVWDYPLEIQHKDGHITPVLYNASVYRDENGEVIGVFAAARDITERKKTEDTLKKAHESLEKMVEERTTQLEIAYNSLKESEKGLAEAQKMAHIGNWEWDRATDKVYWSEEMYRIFGRNPQESGATYNEFLNYIHPDDRDYMDNAHQKALNGKPYDIEYRIVLANGEERTFHMQSEVIFDKKNIPIRLKGIVQDITELKKSEEKIQILANIVESSNDAIGTISLEDIITSCNEEAEHVYGYSAEELLGKHTSIVAPPHLDKETKKLSEMIKQGKKIHHHETSRLRKDGKIIDVSITLSPVFDSHGKLTAISFISRDITERKIVDGKLRESEEKYRNIVETANEGIFIIDAEALVTYANKKMTDMLGYTLEEVIGRAIWDFISEEDQNIVKQNLKKRRKGINESYELKLRCKDGSFLWLLVSAKSLFDKDGKFMGSINMLTDITKRKETEEALANIEIARKQEIHHRIKNNLQVISSLLDLQAEKFNNREDIMDSEVLEAFRESQNRVISMALIHEELYKGERTDTLDFSAYLRKLAGTLFQTYSLSSKNIRLYMDLEENAFFDMDIAVPLGIIVNELVSNSLKHAFTEKEGEIRINLCREEKNNEMHKSLFSLTISDNGKGIPENLELGSLESLGLKLVSILVDQLDGEIELKREHGAEFRITFNVAEMS